MTSVLSLIQINVPGHCLVHSTVSHIYVTSNDLLLFSRKLMPSQSLSASETYRLSAGQLCTVLSRCIFVSSKECVQLLDEWGQRWVVGGHRYILKYLY